MTELTEFLFSDAPTCASKMDDQLIGVSSEEAISINCRVSKVGKCQLPVPVLTGFIKIAAIFFSDFSSLLASHGGAEFYCNNLIEVMASAECSTIFHIVPNLCGTSSISPKLDQ